MSIAELFLNEFRQEVVGTRRTLEVVPADRYDYRPHEKSFPLGRLAGHVAEIPAWAEGMVAKDQLDMAAGELSNINPSSAEELMSGWGASVEAFERGLEGVSDEHLGQEWALMAGEQKIYSAPRVVAIRTFVLNHMIHHRGQLQVYLRLLDVPLPSVYGPTADERDFG
jgi:uncharacterized damage-inducible protein DinB